MAGGHTDAVRGSLEEVDLEGDFIEPEGRGEVEGVLHGNGRVVDAMPEGGEILIETEETEVVPGDDKVSSDLAAGKYACLRVSDNGTLSCSVPCPPRLRAD